MRLPLKFSPLVWRPLQDTILKAVKIYVVHIFSLSSRWYLATFWKGVRFFKRTTLPRGFEVPSMLEKEPALGSISNSRSTTVGYFCSILTLSTKNEWGKINHLSREKYLHSTVYRLLDFCLQNTMRKRLETLYTETLEFSFGTRSLRRHVVIKFKDT